MHVEAVDGPVTILQIIMWPWLLAHGDIPLAESLWHMTCNLVTFRIQKNSLNVEFVEGHYTAFLRTICMRACLQRVKKKILRESRPAFKIKSRNSIQQNHIVHMS